MLKLFIQGRSDHYDEDDDIFIACPAVTLRLEHSLVSVSKWESRFEVPFLGKDDRTREETNFYVECMSLDGEISPGVISRLTKVHFEQINHYVNAEMTATKINERPGGSPVSREIITSELIYYWMFSLGIPMECQYWHLKRLLMLIRVCQVKSAPPKKMGRKELMDRNRSLNAQRKAQLGTKG